MKVVWVEYDWRAYKFNAANSGSKLTISERGLVVTFSGSARYGKNKIIKIINIVFLYMSTARAIVPIPTLYWGSPVPKILFYYELQILARK